MSKEAIQNAPGFDKDNWPDMTDPTWRSGIDRHYGYGRRAAARPRRSPGAGSAPASRPA